MTSPILVVIDDLFFLAKVQQAAQSLGVSVAVTSPARVVLAAEQAQASGIILDLNYRSGSALEALRALKSSPALAAVPIVGFVSHVQSEVIAAARAAGCDQVLARSAFSRDLPQILSRLAKPQPAQKRG